MKTLYLSLLLVVSPALFAGCGSSVPATPAMPSDQFKHYIAQDMLDTTQDLVDAYLPKLTTTKNLNVSQLSKPQQILIAATIWSHGYTTLGTFEPNIKKDLVAYMAVEGKATLATIQPAKLQGELRTKLNALCGIPNQPTHSDDHRTNE